MASFSDKPAPWREIRIQKSIENAPARGGSVLIDTCKGLLIFGGSDREQNSFQDLMLFPVLELGSKIVANSWQVIETDGDIPMPRSGHAVVTYGNYLFLFGGQQALENETYSDLYVLDLNTWVWKYVGEKGDEPEERNSHSLAIIRRILNGKQQGEEGEKASTSIIEYHDYLVLYGGAHDEKGVYDSTYYALLPTPEDENQIHNDTFYITWQTLTKHVPHPIAREMHGSALLSTPTCAYKSLFISGGRGLDTVYGDVWELTATTHYSNPDAEPLMWVQRNDMEMNPPRCSHDSTIVEKNGEYTLCVVGGFSGDALADNLAYCSASLWTDANTENTTTVITTADSVIDQHHKETLTSTVSGSGEKEITESLIDAEVEDRWKEVRLASMRGGRFGLSVCSAPEWLLIAAKLKPKQATSTEEGAKSGSNASAIVVYGGINMTDIYNDTVLIVPPMV